jgi:hypothetical protein
VSVPANRQEIAGNTSGKSLPLRSCGHLNDGIVVRVIGSSLIEPELIDRDAENPGQRLGDKVPDWPYRLGSHAVGWPSRVVAHARVHTRRC